MVTRYVHDMKQRMNAVFSSLFPVCSVHDPSQWNGVTHNLGGSSQPNQVSLDNPLQTCAEPSP